MFNIIELKNRTGRELSVKDKQVKYLIHSVKHDLRQKSLRLAKKFKISTGLYQISRQSDKCRHTLTK